MNEKPIISIIVPTYNAEKHVANIIKIVINQTFKNFELIIVDDLSKDKTVEIAKKFSDERIRIIERKINSGGPYAPRLDGVNASRGEWILYLDVDDSVDPNFVEELYNRVVTYDVDACSPQMIRVNEKLVPLGWVIPSDNFAFDRVYSGYEAFNLTVPKWKIGMNGALIKKEVWVRATRIVSTRDIVYRSDEVLSRFLLLESRTYIACRAKYYYIDNPESVTGKFSLKYFGWIKSNSIFRDLIEERFGKESQEYRNIIVYDFYSYLSTLSLFVNKITEETLFREAYQHFLIWRDKLEWNILSEEAKSVKKKLKVFFLKRPKLTIMYLSIRMHKYHVLKWAMKISYSKK